MSSLRCGGVVERSLAPNAGDDADGALFAKLGLLPLAGEEPMRAEREPAE